MSKIGTRVDWVVLLERIEPCLWHGDSRIQEKLARKCPTGSNLPSWLFGREGDRLGQSENRSYLRSCFKV